MTTFGLLYHSFSCSFRLVFVLFCFVGLFVFLLLVVFLFLARFFQFLLSMCILQILK